MRYFNDAFSIAVGVFAIIMFIVMLVTVVKMDRLMKRAGEKDYDPAQARPQLRRMLYATGGTMFAVGLLLIVMGSWANSIAVIGMGILIIIGAWTNVLTGGRDLR